MSLEEKEEKIMNEIRKRTSDVPIPDSLSPENMMKKIKASGVKQNEKVKQKNKGIKWNFVFAFAGMAFAFCMVMGVILMNNNTLFIENKTDDREEETNLSAAENFVISNVDGIDNISRKEAIDIFKTQLLNMYVKNESNIRYDYDESSIYDVGIQESAGENGGITNSPFLDGNPAESASQKNESVYGGEASDDYYENNDQVKGVTEGDIVITDGRYIYSMSKETGIINIVKIDNGKMEKMSKIDCYKAVDGDFDDNYSVDDAKLYITDNKIAVVLCISVYDYGGGAVNNTDIYNDVYYSYPSYAESKIYVLDYDITDIQSPEEAGKATVEGREISSRMAGNYLYIMSEKTNPVSSGFDSIKEAFEDIEENAIPKINGKEVTEDRMYICGESEDIDAVQLICALDINDGLKVTDTCATLTGGSEVYVSNASIYIIDNVYISSEEYRSSEVNTIISKYNYSDGKITVYAQGTVSGSVLNQFSLDENEGYLRIVTDTIYTDENRVYILDDKLNITGELLGIAEGEDIKSVRFLGDRAYFVTFRQTDPLFVVDLSDNTNPVILDELKVTGFSSYLHRWSDNLLLGIGSEAADDGIVTGAKISMFNMADDKLSEADRFVIDNGYLFDMNMSYKNVLVDAGKNLIGLGVYENNAVTDQYNYTHIETVYYYGLYNYENGKINNILKYENENINKSDRDEYYDVVYRGLYVGDYLYIITIDKGIQSVNLKDMSYVQYLNME